MNARRTLTVAVLAGGRSRRMGRDKAFLEVDGARLLDRQLRLARELSPKQVLISGRPGVVYGCPGIPVICDLRPEAGPLAALEAILGFSMTSHALIIAVDLPALSGDLLNLLWSHARPDGGMVPRTDRRWEPLVGVYARQSLPRVRRLLDAGERAMHVFVAEAAEQGEIDALALPGGTEAKLLNWNCPGDFSPRSAPSRFSPRSGNRPERRSFRDEPFHR